MKTDKIKIYAQYLVSGSVVLSSIQIRQIV
jgi:hypothetical protein